MPNPLLVKVVRQVHEQSKAHRLVDVVDGKVVVDQSVQVQKRELCVHVCMRTDWNCPVPVITRRHAEYPLTCKDQDSTTQGITSHHRRPATLIIRQVMGSR